MAEYTISKIAFGGNVYNLSSGSVNLPIASDTTLGGIKVGSGLSINSTTGVLSATGGGTADSVDWQNVTSKPTTISGYGITDASISNGTITLGSNSITPLTSHQDISGKVDAEVTSSGLTGTIDNSGQSISLNVMTGSTTNSTLGLHNTYTNLGTDYATVSTVNDSTPSTGSSYVILSASNNSNTNQGVKVTPTQTIIKNIPTPTNNGDAANKKYVDDSVSGKANAATTIAGYGITDAKIANGTITLGSNTITPLTSETYQGTVTSVQVQATSPVNSSTSTAQSSTLNTTISLADAYGDTKNPYGSKTSHYVLAAPNGSNGTPSFRALVAADIPDLSSTYSTTDEKLKTTSASNNTTYYPVFGTSTSDAETKFKDTNGFKYITQSSTGKSLLILGNGASGTSNSRCGAIELYGTTTYSTELTSGAPTAARTISLPDKSGTIALTDDIPNISNKADKSTTLAGYGITDAKIESGTITLGSNTITPLTSETYTGTVTSVQVAATSPVVSSSDSASSTTLSTTISLADAYGDTKNPYGLKSANNVLSSPTSNEITNLTNTIWCFNSTVDLSQSQSYQLTFTCEDWENTGTTKTYSGITVNSNTSQLEYNAAGTTWFAFKNNAWQHEEYRTITITGGLDVADSDTITWIKANASIVGGEPVFRNLIVSDIPDLSDLYIGTYGITDIAENTNLNNITAIGVHKAAGAVVSTLSNCPTSQAFSMRVTSTIASGGTSHRQQELIDVYGFRWVRDIVTGGTAAQHWKLLNILDRIDLSYFATSEIPVYGASTEQVCVLNQNVTSSTVSSAATVMDALCKILPGNSNFRLWWTGNSYNESSYGGYRFGNIGAAMPQAYGALFIEKDYDNMALCKFIGYSPYTVWTGIWTSVNNNGWQGWIPTAQTSVSRLTFSDVFDTSVVTAYTSGTSTSNDYMATYLDKDGRSVSGWICFKNVSATTAGGSGVTIGTLPEGWRPYRIFQVGTIPTTTDRRLLINKAGSIRLYTSASVAANTVMYFKVDFIAVS